MTPPIDFKTIANLADCLRRTGVPALSTAHLKQEPEDFVVDEIPSYEPGGEGEHLFLWIQKRDLTTDQLRGHIARTLDVPGRDIGIAGNKDRRAVTRQFISVPASRLEKIGELETPAVQVLKHELHNNKLRTGHLRGNRFDILLRSEITGEHQVACEAKLQRLSETGFANYFGTQRFGGGDTVRLGWELLTGQRSRSAMAKEFGRSLFRLSLSALQSAMFNIVVSRRIESGTVDRVQAGDVVMFRDRRTHFTVEDAGAEQQRLDAGELVITGPIFGKKMSKPTGPTAELEREVFEMFGLPDDAFGRYPKLTMGTRRPLLRWPEQLEWQFVPEGLRLQFSLNSGTYATVLLRELTNELLLSAPSADGSGASAPCAAESAEDRV